MSGHVFLVGAGPGDPGLLTVRAARLLDTADVVVHDALVGPEVMALVRGDRIDVGKRRGKHKAEQDAISQLLVEHAQQGKQVVRLKGGDPFLFGRGHEELTVVRAAGIPCTVVPGVSSAIAGPEAAGIPVTHRDHSGAVTIVTGHGAAAGRLPIQWEALADTDHTLVILMGFHKLPLIAEQLMADGRSPDTPAAVVQHATLPTQKVVRAPLKDIAEAAEGLVTPAIVVVGPVAQLY